jgi:methylamine utilization protein MauE
VRPTHAILHLITAVVGAMFVAAAFGKVDAWPRWSATSAALLGTHANLRRLVRVGLPTVEAAIGALAFVRPVWGLASGSALLFVLAAGVLALRSRSAGTECGCFGALMPSQIGLALALRNLSLALVAAVAAFFAHRIGAPAFRFLELVVIALVGLHVVVVAELVRMPSQVLRGASELRPRSA